MRTFALLLVLIFAAVLVAAPVPLPSAREAERLVEKLGSDEFQEREAATKRLEELGPLALESLRAASKSDNPEVADRAKDLVRKIERRMASDRVLMPTMVELDAKDTPLDDILAELAKQAGCEVVLGGLKADDLAPKKFTIATGKVPFWAAVVKVCDAAEVQVAAAGGFLAPGSLPYYPRRVLPDGVKTRVAADPNRAVILETRDGEKKRPASVHGAVLVESLTPQRGSGSKQQSTTLQFWPEPRLTWQSVSHAKLTRAVDGEGRKLTPELTPTAPIRGVGMPQVRPQGKEFEIVGLSKTNTRQLELRFKPNDPPSPLARELTGLAFGLVRSGNEPLATLTLDPQKEIAVTGQGGVELTASTRSAAKKEFVDVKLVFSPTTVDAARTSEELIGVKLSSPGGNRTMLGVRITDAEGEAFTLALASQRSDFDRVGNRIIVNLSLEVVFAKDGPTAPAKVAFWGSIARPVEVPFSLKDVPLR